MVLLEYVLTFGRNYMQKNHFIRGKKSNTHWFLLLKIIALDEPHEGHLEMQVKKLNQQKSNILLGK